MKYKFTEEIITPKKIIPGAGVPKIVKTPKTNKKAAIKAKIYEYIGYLNNGHKQYLLAGCKSASELKGKIIGLIDPL